MTFPGFYVRTNPECDDRVRLSNQTKMGGWPVDHLFEAAYSGDVLAHPRITSALSVNK